MSAIPAMTGIPAGRPVAFAARAVSVPAMSMQLITAGIFSRGTPVSPARTRDHSLVLLSSSPVPAAPVWSITLFPVALKTRYPVVSRNVVVQSKTSGSFSFSQASLQTTSLPEGTAPARRSNTRLPPSLRTIRAACSSARLSIHIIAGRSGFPVRPMGIMPIIWPAKPMPITRPGSTPLSSNSRRVPEVTPRPQSPGPCSARPGPGWETRYGSNADARILPPVSARTDLLPPVPTS